MNKFFLNSLLLLTMPLLQGMQKVIQGIPEAEIKEAADASQQKINCRLIEGDVRIASYGLIEYEDSERELDTLVDEPNNQLVSDPGTLLVKVSVETSFETGSDIEFRAFDTIALSKKFSGETWELCISDLYLPVALFEGKKDGDVVSFLITGNDESIHVKLTCRNDYHGSLFENDIAMCKKEYAESQNPCLRLRNACENLNICERFQKVCANEALIAIHGLEELTWQNAIRVTVYSGSMLYIMYLLGLFDRAQ